MVEYSKINYNPKNRKTSDCVIRAITCATGKKYEDVYKDLFEVSLKTGYMVNDKQCYEKVLEKYGFTKMKQPRKWDNTKYKVGEIDEIMSYGSIAVVSMAHHLTCVECDTLYDIWDCRYKTIGNYYVKERG